MKVDVHRTDVDDAEPVLKPISNKIFSDKRHSKYDDLKLSEMENIQVLASENSISSQSTKQDRQLRGKPRWSLRIKLQSSVIDSHNSNVLSIMYSVEKY